MGATKTLLIIVLALAIILYIQAYLKPKQEYTIIQTYLDKITQDTLQDKYPIVIYDLIHEPRTLLDTLFAYQFAFSNNKTLSEPTNEVIKARSKYNIIYSDNDSSTINIISPKHTAFIKPKTPLQDQSDQIQYITIKLKKHQVMILPLSWYFATKDPVKIITLDDLLSALLNSFNII